MKRPRLPEGAIWKGPSELVPFLVPLGDLDEDPGNARLHSDRNVEAIKLSLDEFGQRKPIVKRGRIIVAGNGTRRAAEEKGWTHLAALGAEDLTSEQAVAYGLADNQSGALAEWDYSRVADTLRVLPEELRLSTGFSQYEIDPMLAAEWRPPPPNAGGTHGVTHPDGGETGVVFFSATPEQAEIISRAIQAVRDGGDGPPDATDGRCLELICASWMLDPNLAEGAQ